MIEADRDDLLRMFYLMRLTRALDDRLRTLYLEGHIPGGVAAARGYEATSVGAALALASGDILSPGEHDLGAMLARELSLDAILAQWLARAQAPSRGRDGKGHWGDMRERLVLPQAALPGLSITLAVGAALGAKVRNERRVVLAFLDAPACDLGSVHEAITSAAALDLPIVFVIEHVMRDHESEAVPSLTSRAAAYGIPGTVADGDDPLDVQSATRAALHVARGGRGPSLIEARVSRALPQPDDSDEDHRHRRDPVERFTRYLINSGTLAPEEIARIEDEIAMKVDDAAIAALTAPEPQPGGLTEVFAPADAQMPGPARALRRALVRALPAEDAQ